MADSAQEKTEDATPRRRQEARKKGTVAKSQDLVGAASLFAILLAMPVAIRYLGQGFQEAMTLGFQNASREANLAMLQEHAWLVLRPTLPGLAIIAVAALTVGLVANFAQVGFVLSAEAMNPKLEKIDPIKGLKRLFSARTFVEGLKAILKATLFGVIGYTTIMANWSQLAALSTLSATDSLRVIGGTLHSLALKIAGAWLALAILDYIFQRKQTEKQLRMTKQEVRQEMKDMETSPELRAKLAERRRKLAKGKLSDSVRSADAIVTNPTHYAVAIQYKHGEMVAPIVVAKGQDWLALKIRELAATHDVPIIPNPPLARALYRRCDVGDMIPKELFKAVAEVLAYVYQSVGKRRRR